MAFNQSVFQTKRSGFGLFPSKWLLISVGLLVLVILGVGGIYLATRQVADRQNNQSTISRATLDPNANCETRAVWLNNTAFNSAALRTSLITKLKAANINTLFIATPPIGSNSGWSNANDFKALLSDPYIQTLSLHVWTYNIGRIKGQESDYTSATEQAAQAKWAVDLLVAYPQLDGVHLDYIRYPDPDRGFPTNLYGILVKEKIEGVNKTVKAIYEAINNRFPGNQKTLSAAVKPINTECINGEDNLPSWFMLWCQDSANQESRWYETSACSYTQTCDSVPGQLAYQQDSVSWVNGGYIDFVVDMEYPHINTNNCRNNCWWKDEVDQWKLLLGNKVSQVVMGLGWYDDMFDYDEDSGKNTYTQREVAVGIIDRIEYGQDNNLKGFAIFEFNKEDDQFDDAMLIPMLKTNGSSTEVGPYQNERKSCMGYSNAVFTSPTVTPLPTHTPLPTPEELPIETQPAATATATPLPTATTQPAATATSQPNATATQPAATATTKPVATATSKPVATATQPAATSTVTPNKSYLQIRLKLAGVPIIENSQQIFQPNSAGQKLPFKVILEDKLGHQTSLVTYFIYHSTSDGGYYQTQNALDLSSLAVGRYHLLIKGPKHHQFRFCQSGQTKLNICARADLAAQKTTTTIALTRPMNETVDLRGVELGFGDLAISGTNKNLVDGKVNVSDYSYLLSCLTKRHDPTCVTKADGNFDGLVTNEDLDLLMKTLSWEGDQI